jgi:predicted peptidase
MNHLAMPVYRHCLRYALIILVLCYRKISVRALDISNHKNSLDRRSAIAGGAALLSCPFAQPPSKAFGLTNDSNNSVFPSLNVVTDPESYSALSYAPPNNANNANTPLILVLPGAGKNDKDILQELANPIGEHAGLIPSLIASHTAPSNLLDNFCVLAPYSFGKPSFYDDPRRNLLQFVDWAIQNQNTEALPLRFDPRRIILFGFSDGATVAVELLTTKRFAAGVICSYGYSGKSLPPQALDLLANLPIWVFHSSDDVLFDVHNSDRLVQQLENVNGIKGGTTNASSIIKYSRYNSDPENLPPRVKGHSMGITASKSTELYDWMMGQVN